MFHPEAVVGVVAVVAAFGLVGSMVIKTVVGGLVRIKAASAPSAASVPPAQEERLAQMEAEIAALRDEVGRLSAVESFYAQLQAPRPRGEASPRPGAPGPSA